jgi:hypothetical protein
LALSDLRLLLNQPPGKLGGSYFFFFPVVVTAWLTMREERLYVCLLLAAHRGAGVGSMSKWGGSDGVTLVQLCGGRCCLVRQPALPFWTTWFHPAGGAAADMSSL